jgi:hypothetical protein
MLSLGGCKDSFFDVNTPSNVIDKDAVSVKTQLPYIEARLASMHFSVAYTTARYSQQISSYFVGGADSHERTSLGGAWSTFYLRVLSNLRVLEEKAEAEGLNHYLGVAQVLEALAVQLATDQWGDIPYSEAGFAGENLYPAVDSQEDIYNALLTLLDQAIANLSAPANGMVPGSDDIIYGGDIDKWIKAAYTLKARIHLHLTKRNPSEAVNVLNALQNGFTSYTEDMQLYYDQTARNPWYTTVVAARRTGNLSVLWSEQLIDYMNGTDYPFNTIPYDPRLPLYADNGGASDYRGAVNGSGGLDPSGGSANADLADNAYFSETAPIFMLTYMEAKFMEAEANLMLGNAPAAYTAYLDGITASMDKLGIPSADRDAYLNEPSIGVGAGNLTMEHVMKEKYIALVVHPEVWTDMRRHDFDPAVYVDLTYPDNRSTDIPAGEWPRRAVYPNSEVDRNPNVEQVEEWWSRLWWDQ